MTRPLQGGDKKWLVLAVASSANFLTILDLWAVSIAYPALERAFAPTTLSDVSWILNVYTILLAAFLIPAGRLADSVGRRTCFLAGLVLFGIASLGCALAPVLPALIAYRREERIHRRVDGLGRRRRSPGSSSPASMPTSPSALAPRPVEGRDLAFGTDSLVTGAGAAS